VYGVMCGVGECGLFVCVGGCVSVWDFVGV